MRRNLFRAAALIAAITVVARLAGFLRTFVFARTVGSSCVGVVYQTANTVPNIVFDIVAGGTLTALVVPLVAPHLATGDRQAAGRTVSALLSWAIVSLCAVGLLIFAFSGPITRLLLGPQPCAGADDLGRRMLIVFAPQVVLYGCAVIVAGTLQAAERFSWPALAPLMSSLVVIGAYLAFNAMKTGNGIAASLPTTAELVLSVGTTARGSRARREPAARDPRASAEAAPDVPLSDRPRATGPPSGDRRRDHPGRAAAGDRGDVAGRQRW